RRRHPVSYPAERAVHHPDGNRLVLDGARRVSARARLKGQNSTWIWTVVAADAVALAGFAFPSVADQITSWLASARLAGASLAPVIVLLLTSILPTELKEALVFWRVRDVLPGHRAFSVYAQKDPRIDLNRLQ